MVIGLALGLLAAPATSSALKLFHSPDPDGTTRVEFPVRVSQSSPPSLNLWMDPDDPSDDAVLNFDMIVTSSGSLTVSFACALGTDCVVGGDPNTVGIVAVNIAQHGWESPFKVGTFDLNADGSVGDELTLDSGAFELEISGEGIFAPTTLAEVRGCGDGVLDLGEECDGDAGPCPGSCSDSCVCGTETEPDKAAQKCVNSINKGAAKVAKAQAGDNAKCIKNGGKGKLTPGPSPIEECITSDPKGKVQKAIGKIKTGDCSSAPAFPPIDTNAVSIGGKMKDRALDLIHAIFGTDLDAVVVSADDDKPGAGCQAAIAKAVGKCQDAKLAGFNSCKKNKLKGKDTSAAKNSGELQDECLPADGTGIPDGKGKIAKKCATGLASVLSKKCAVGNLNDLVPGCAPGVDADCLEKKVKCEVCRALKDTDGLDRICDEFHSGVVDGSCP
jgi:hypothetical protein